MKSLGVAGPDVIGYLAQAANLRIEAVEEATTDFCGRGILFRDEETGEIFVRDWFRFHVFRGAIRAGAPRELAKIRSVKIRKIIKREAPNDLFPEKTGSCKPTSASSPSSIPQTPLPWNNAPPGAIKNLHVALKKPPCG